MIKHVITGQSKRFYNRECVAQVDATLEGGQVVHTLRAGYIIDRVACPSVADFEAQVVETFTQRQDALSRGYSLMLGIHREVDWEVIETYFFRANSRVIQSMLARQPAPLPRAVA